MAYPAVSPLANLFQLLNVRVAHASLALETVEHRHAGQLPTLCQATLHHAARDGHDVNILRLHLRENGLHLLPYLGVFRFEGASKASLRSCGAVGGHFDDALDVLPEAHVVEVHKVPVPNLRAFIYGAFCFAQKNRESVPD
eukprot:TRINITY_DN34399_c0_g1_i2.p1 TRINITY_DN34399_c0_g1~~TRINITY_DN34399_c0_g1_i2.p1  ORF type:complete len:141 (+),score=9.60 TRINITY_DN34399_c0_g1_i2:332-754(+)